MRVFLPLCLFGLLLEPTRALVDFPDAKIDSSKPNLLTAGLPWGNTAGKKKAGICGDGVTDLQTEECDEGKENGEPESVCFTNCTFKPEVKCGEVLIDTTTALEEAQVCRTAEKIVFELDTPTDVVLPNLVFVSGNVEGNQGPNLMTSLSMPNVIAILDRIVFGVESKDTVSIDFPSLLFTAKLEFRRFNQEIGDMKLRSASLPKLISTNFDVELQNLPELSVLVLDSLEFCREDLDLISLPSLVSVSLPSLFHTRDVILKDMEGLVSFDAPKLYSLQGKVDILDVPALKVFSTPQLTLGGDIPNWKVEGNLISPSGPLLELCSLPAFEVNYIQNTICTSCTAAGAQTPECARTDKEKEKSVEKNGGLFDLSGLTYLGSGEKFDLSDILPSSFEGGMLFQQNEKETGGSAFGKKETKKEDGCPNPYPSLQEKKKEKAPVCGNDIVEIGEECDGDARVCNNTACLFKPEAICTDFKVNSTEDLAALESCAVIIDSDGSLGPGAPEVVSLPLLQAFYGDIEATLTETAYLFKTISFPNAWKTPDLQIGASTSGSNFVPFALEVVDLPCAREASRIRVRLAPQLKQLNLPLVQYSDRIQLRDSTDASNPLDIILPNAFMVQATTVENCPGIQRILYPSAIATRSTDLKGNANLEVVSYPLMSKMITDNPTLENNPSLRQVDRASQLFFDAPIVVSGNSPEGITLLVCSLNAIQANQIEAEGQCSPSSDPPCFLVGAGEKECSKGGDKGKEGASLKPGDLLLDPEAFDFSGLFKG